MCFSEDYFENEVREGFFVPSMVKRAWAAELDVLANIDRICTKYGIQYFAEWGTLLGAVRHNGFIPWDDDLDIGMKRTDYERFLEVAYKELPDGYVINNLRNRSDFHLFLARVMNTGHMCFENEYLKNNHEFPYIAGVDIFLIDYVSRDEEKEKNRDTITDYGIVLADYIYERKISQKEAIDGLKNLMEKGFPRVDYNIEYIISWLQNDSVDDKLTEYIEKFHQRMYIQAEKLFGAFGEAESDELTQLFPFGLRRKEHRYPKEYYADSVRLPFENTTIPVPIGYDAMLKRRYGDYMVIRKDGGGHGYPFYESQQEQLDALMGETLPKYTYNEQEKAYSTRQAGRESEETENFEKLAVEVCEELIACDDPVVAQELAVDFGTMIESLYAEGLPVVNELEHYCELQYEKSSDSEKTNEKTNVKTYKQEIYNSVEIIKQSLQRDIFNLCDAVFIVTKASQWRYVERKCDELLDSGARVYVVVVPYYHKRFDGSLYDECFEYEQFVNILGRKTEGRTDNRKVKIVRYDEYNMSLHYPDYVYIQNPYDRWDGGESIHPSYYTDYIVNNCKRMIYVPSFVVDDFDVNQYREYHNMACYTLVPGVVRADKVLVQSEQMRDAYIQKLTEWAGEESRLIWEQKLCAAGGQKQCVESREELQAKALNTIPESWKEKIFKADGSRKKIIIYHNEAAFFIENREKAIEKIRRSFRVFEDSADNVVMIWDIGKAAIQAVVRVAPELKDDIISLKEEAGRIGIHDENDINELTKLTDAYYGDGSYISRMCSYYGKPVMIESVEI